VYEEYTVTRRPPLEGEPQRDGDQEVDGRDDRREGLDRSRLLLGDEEDDRERPDERDVRDDREDGNLLQVVHQ
jgi:hypothetical protein